MFAVAGDGVRQFVIGVLTQVSIVYNQYSHDTVVGQSKYTAYR